MLRTDTVREYDVNPSPDYSKCINKQKTQKQCKGYIKPMEAETPMERLLNDTGVLSLNQ